MSLSAFEARTVQRVVFSLHRLSSISCFTVCISGRFLPYSYSIRSPDLTFRNSRPYVVARLVEALRYKLVRFPMVSLEFFSDIILSVALLDSASNRNEYQEEAAGA